MCSCNKAKNVFFFQNRRAVKNKNIPEDQQKLEVYESVHRDTTMKITKKMHYID